MGEGEAPEPEEIPRWDVALEALVREEYSHLGRDLRLADFQRLARHYAIRLDDILATLFELVIEGRWVYEPTGRGDAPITRELLDGLYVGGRLHARDVAAFEGSWRPAS